MLGGINIIKSEALLPDFFEVTYPPKPWIMYGKYYNKRQLRKYGRKLRASAKPVWMQGLVINGAIYVHPTLYDKIIQQANQ